MIEVKNQFARHGMFWLWVLPFALLLFLPACSEREAMRVPREEVQTVALLGQDVEAITRRADAIFHTLFVATGATRASDHLFRSKVNGQDPDFFRNLAISTNNYFENVWNMIYRAVWRLAGLWPTLMTLMLALALPCMVDGLVVRAKKVDVFQAHNPVFFWGAGHSLVMVVGIFFLLPLLPIPISLYMLYGAVGAVAAALWVTAANLQTGS